MKINLLFFSLEPELQFDVFILDKYFDLNEFTERSGSKRKLLELEELLVKRPIEG